MTLRSNVVRQPRSIVNSADTVQKRETGTLFTLKRGEDVQHGRAHKEQMPPDEDRGVAMAKGPSANQPAVRAHVVEDTAKPLTFKVRWAMRLRGRPRMDVPTPRDRSGRTTAGIQNPCRHESKALAVGSCQEKVIHDS